MKSFLAILLAAFCLCAYAADPDANLSPVRSCEWNKVRDETGDLAGVSWQDQAAVCREMQSALGGPPPVGLLRMLCKVVFVMTVQGSRDSPREIAFQVMNVVEARGQTGPAEMRETFDQLTKIFNGTNGRVTPKDMNINFRAYGPRASKLSQDGVFRIAAVIYERKKAGQE